MKTDLEYNKKLWRKVQVNKCSRVLLIFLGCLLMQMIAYMLLVIGYVALYMADGVPAEQLIYRLQGHMRNPDSGLLIGLSALSAVLCLIWCGILYSRSDWRQKDFSYRRAFTGRRLLGIAELAFGSCVVISVLLTLLANLFPQAFQPYQEMMSHLDVDNSWFTLLYVLVIGPASEEMIFRGAIMDRLKIAFPFWVANALQAVLFGVYHLNLIQGIYAFLLGMLLGLVREVEGTILAAILTHILFNSTSELLGICFTGTGTVAQAEMSLTFLLAVFCFVHGFRYFLAEWKTAQSEGGIDRENVV